ncbi:Acetylcholinesterase-1 [Araneus ventricosus]|uniref:acetylcholinesterase n=1 Tax=Araneus ventricosus TaxID=182803 RepID=A0A4Y2IIG8_ARAVE|nr:Acetylcholinesterase-1 [Araneus ventricosus]
MISLAVQYLSCEPVIQIGKSKLIGQSVRLKEREVNQFLSVPYAQPPIGQLRFKKPEPILNYPKELHAFNLPPACHQYTESPFPWYANSTHKSEDCLYLNIWTPSDASPANRKAVLYWIFGGGFRYGSIRLPVYSGTPLAALGDIIVVTVNYRVGPFGFLTSSTHDAPGNVGIWDILEGLRWVNKYIGYFGGDTSRITIAGESAGSVAVGLLAVSPLAKGLYKRQIMESGSPTYMSADNNTQNLAFSQRLAEMVGCASSTFTIKDYPGPVVKCLKRVDAVRLAKADYSLKPDSTTSFIPQYGDEILPSHPRKAIMRGDLQCTELLIGNNKDEGSFHNFHTHFEEEYANYRKPPDGARIVRHNDKSVREGYIRNGGKEVKLFTSALKAFQCNNRIVMAQRKHLDDFLRGRIIGRLEWGRTQLEVSEELGIAQSVISRLWQRFQDDGNVSRCYSTCRPRVTTPNEDRYLAVTAKRNKRSTASDLSRQLSSATGTTVSGQTVYRRLGHIGLYARRPVRCIPLTATHCRLRLAWSREHALWTPQQWSCVMFSDESRFSLQSDSRRTFIWRAPGTRYHQENTIERHRYGGAGWLVWGGIILGSRTDLYVQSVTMTGHIYRDVILEQHVRLFRGAMGAEFLFMDDNARPHRANIVDECLQSEDITRMDWPAYSPDLNPIEYVWDMLGRRIAARQPPPTCLPELRRALLDEWCNIPQDQIDNLILSMPRRCKACIASSGRHTPY